MDRFMQPAGRFILLATAFAASACSRGSAARATPEAARSAAASPPSGDSAKTAAAKQWLAANHTPLTQDEFNHATQACDVERVKLFLAAGMDPNAIYSAGMSPLDYLVLQAPPDGPEKCDLVITLLMQAGGRVNGEHLLAAAGRKRRTLVDLMIHTGKLDPNYATAEGWTAAHSATFNGNLEVIAALHEAGANLNAADHHGVTPLIQAVQRGDRDMVRYLLSLPRLAVNPRDPLKRTALGWARLENAARQGADPKRAEIVELLVAAGGVE